MTRDNWSLDRSVCDVTSTSSEFEAESLNKETLTLLSSLKVSNETSKHLGKFTTD